MFHPDFKAMPFWWEAYHPAATDPVDVPPRARVAIVGGGYAGLSTALEAAKQGIDCVVLEAAELGFGASTRNGGAVSGGVNIGKSFSGKSLDPGSDRARAVLADGADAFGVIERLITEEKIDCAWQKNGRFVGAWTPAHYQAQAKKVAMLNEAARSEAWMLPRERQREEMASDYYHGGMVVERSASLHPALYYKGLLDACKARGIPVCALAGVEKSPNATMGGRFGPQGGRCRQTRS
jgi:glycine/D-amino acid oxidase-like deaminating enzyme